MWRLFSKTLEGACQGCHSERSEESRIALKTLRARFLAPLGMTVWSPGYGLSGAQASPSACGPTLINCWTFQVLRLRAAILPLAMQET